ncbi:hypothetical protein DJ71_03685, partial [Halorubrum sp. E3]
GLEGAGPNQIDRKPNPIDRKPNQIGRKPNRTGRIRHRIEASALPTRAFCIGSGTTGRGR